jgi:hypothetical protein
VEDARHPPRVFSILPMFGKRLAGDGPPHLLVLPMFGKFGAFLPNIGKNAGGCGGRFAFRESATGFPKPLRVRRQRAAK